MEQILKVNIKLWRENAKVPVKANKSDAGYDCFVSCFKVIDSKNKKLIDDMDTKNKKLTEELILKSHERACCGLGFSTELPDGWYAQICPRSGLAVWQGITITNSPGTIDNGYRNEWTALIVNTSNEPVTIKLGDKICQAMLKRSPDIDFNVVKELSESDRGMGGYGSSDKKP